MLEFGLEVMDAINCRRGQSRAVAAECLEERARVAAVLRARALKPGIERAVFAVGPEIGPFPQWHQTEYPRADPPHAALAVSLQQVQFLEPLERPEWEIDLDAVWVEDLPVEIVRQGFAYDRLVDFGAPARSRRVMTYRSFCGVRKSIFLSPLF